MGRPIIIFLALSLAANLFLGSVVAGRIAGPHFQGFRAGADLRGDASHHGGRDADPRHEFEELPPAVREKLKDAFRENREEFVETFREGRALQREFVSILTADVFDRPAAETAAAKIEAFEGERRRSMPRLVIEAMDGLDVEDRRALAAVVERRIIDDMGGAGRRHHRRGRVRDGKADDAPVTPPAE